MYILQLDPTVPQAPYFSVSWPGYWAGIGYVEDPQKAIRFRTKREAAMACGGLFVGLNGCIKIRKI